MKRIFTLFLLLTFLFTAFSQQSNCPPVTHNGVTYQTIWMGGNCWMKENLRSTTYGTQSNVTDLYPGLTPTYMVYPGAPLSMGYLYTWYSAVGLPEGSTNTPPTAISERVQGICPNEWAIPSAAQLQALINAGETRAAASSYWTFNNGFIPAGPYNFTMVPSGFYNARFGQFAELNHVGYIWTLNYNGATSTCGIFPFDCRNTATMNMNKNSLLSVRCVKAPPYGVEEMTVCDSVTWNGRTLYTTGRYVANLPNDSVSTLLLTVNYTTYATANVTACDSYTWDVNGKTYTTSGTHMGVIKNHKNCDSVVTLNLTINYQNTGIDVQNHCDSYTWIDGITYYESTNEPTFVLPNANATGCDSVVTLNLTIRKATTGIDVQDHCDSYTWIDGITYNESTNEPTFTLTNSVGCDSVVTLNLTIRNKTYGIDVQNHCDTYTWINDVTYSESTNEPVFTITNEAGCDSIVTLDLTINYSNSSPSQSYFSIGEYSWNDINYNKSGIYNATLTNVSGCDSTATLDLLIEYSISYNPNGGELPSIYPINYIQGVGATLPIPTKLHNRFEGWYDNPDFTGSPKTTITNSDYGNQDFWALWTILETGQNSSLAFTGTSSSYASIPDAPALNITNAITLEAWINPASWIYRGTIVSKESTNRGYVLRISSSGALSFAFGTSSTVNEIITVSPHPLVLNEWQHVAATYDGTTMKLYRNGVEVATKAQTGLIASNTNSLDISRSSLSTSRYFNGKIDEVRIFNVALDASTIQSWYNKSINNSHSNYANLVGYYEFENTSDPTVLSGTIGTNGTVTGATYSNGESCNFETNSPYFSVPHFSTAIHPIQEFNNSMYPVVPGDTLSQILQIAVTSVLDGNVNKITVSTNGTTNPSDITKARLWYTGPSNSFNTNTSYGNPVLNPNGTISFFGNAPISCGVTQYFWLTYDISLDALYDNVVDAELINCTVERLEVPSTNGAPVGNRKVVNPCSDHILQIRDSFGDTWNGNIISVLKNSEVIFSNLTVSGNDKNWYNYPFKAGPNDTIKIIRTTSGSFINETRVQIVRGSQVTMSAIQLIEQPSYISNIVANLDGCSKTILATSGTNGTINPSGIFYMYGNRSQLFSFTPNQFYYVEQVLVNGNSTPSAVTAGNYTFSNITDNQTIHVNFNTNHITPTLVTPPNTTSAIQGVILSTLPLSGGLVQHNGGDVSGTFTWTTPTTTLTAPGNYSVTFTPTDLSTYFPITFDIFVNVSITSLTVANGTSTNSYLPFYGLYMDDPQNSFVLYPDTMLTAMVGRTITQLVFYHSSTTSYNFTSTSTINLGPTTLTELPTTGAPAYTPTTVFVGTVDRNSNGTVTITLNTPYLYTGGSLMLNFVNPDGSSAFSSTSFYGVARTNCGRYTYNTTTNRQNFVPKTKFELVP